MKYKVGDIVKVREDLQEGCGIGNFFVNSDMVELAGKLVTISSVNDDDNYHIEEDGETYYWINDFFEDDDEDCVVDKIPKDEEKEEEEKSDEYDDIIDEVLSDMTEETKDKLIKEFIKGENNITIVDVPVYDTIYYNGVSIRQIVGSKVIVTNKDGMVTL